MVHKIQDEFLDLLKVQIKTAKDEARAYPNTPEDSYTLPSKEAMNGCWHSLEKLYQGEYSIAINPAGLDSVSGAGKLGVYIMYGTLLYNKANYSFPMESVIRVLNDQLKKQTGEGLSEERLLKIDRETHDRTGNFREQLHYLYDRFNEALEKSKKPTP